MIQRTCSVEDCDAPSRLNGMCRKHERFVRLYGTTDTPDRSPTTRFWAKVDKSSECWIWTAGRTSHGYGTFRANGRTWKAHRWAWEKANGPVPPGLELDHLCRNRLCVNLSHLEAVTHAENLARGAQATATHCKRGHEFTPENTYRFAHQKRACRICYLASSRRAKQRRRA